MKLVKSSDFFVEHFGKEMETDFPKRFHSMDMYDEIENFDDAEYIYCIAYEMLIRTDEYKNLISEYKAFKQNASKEIVAEEFSELNELIKRMNKLGLKKASFLGFDMDDDRQHVFKMIENYDEIYKSKWNVRKLYKIESSLGFENIFYKLIDFYNEKKELYVLSNGKYQRILLSPKEKDEKILSLLKDSDVNSLIDLLYFGFEKGTDKYFKLFRDIGIDEIDDDFLNEINIKKRNLLIPVRSEYGTDNPQFWYRYTIGDVRGGFDKLLKYYIDKDKIYDSNAALTLKEKAIMNPLECYIPCVDRIIKAEKKVWKGKNDFLTNSIFLANLAKDGHVAITAKDGYTINYKHSHTYLVKINPFLPLVVLEDDFLATLKYEDLQNHYIHTEPLFSRPRLMFDEARLVNVPMNLNLSKEELLLYVSKIKDDYDRDKTFVKRPEEMMLNLNIDNNSVEMPHNIKHIEKESNNKRVLPNTRKKFKKSMAQAFYIYDLYKYFYPLFMKKEKELREKAAKEIKKIRQMGKQSIDNISHESIEMVKARLKDNLRHYSVESLNREISYLVDDFSDEKIKYYLAVMKEFIHGINDKDEKNSFKVKYNGKKPDEDRQPKYKNLIIGNSHIMKSTKDDLWNSLGLEV